MTWRHVEDALRVLIDIVDELEKIPALKYAKHLIDKGYLWIDDPRYREKQVDLMLENDERNKKVLLK